MSCTVVELCGLPGSGKSTLADHLRAALGELGTPGSVVDDPISASAPRRARLVRRTAGSARSAVRHPLRTLGSATDIAAVRQPSTRDTASVLAQWLAVCDLTSRARRRPGVHLLQEGLVQTTWTMLLRADAGASPGRLWNRVPAAARSDLVVVLDVPVNVAQARLAARESRHSRTQQLPPDLVRAELDRGRALLEQLLVLAPVPVLRLPGSGVGAAELGIEAARLVLDHPARVGSAGPPR
jgi:hypothetical protein